MKRRFFLAGLIAAPVVAAAAPALAKADIQPENRMALTDTQRVKRWAKAVVKADRAERSGFTEAEIKTISDQMIEHYIAVGRNHRLGILAQRALG